MELLIKMELVTIDVSNMSGQDFADAIFNSKDNCFVITGEENNPALSLINQLELTPKFKLGDRVRLNKTLSDFNGISNDHVYTIKGLESFNEEQFLYQCYSKDDDYTYSFFGYELEPV